LGGTIKSIGKVHNYYFIRARGKKVMGKVRARASNIKDMKARRIGGLLGCPRKAFLFGALDRNSTAQMRRVTKIGEATARIK